MDYRRKSKKGRITIVRRQSSGNLVGRYLDWHAKETVKAKKAIAKIQQERIRKYGDLGRLDKFFFDDLTLGQFIKEKLLSIRIILVATIFPNSQFF